MVVRILRSVPSDDGVFVFFSDDIEPRDILKIGGSLLYCWYCNNFHRRDKFSSRERLLQTSFDKRHCLKWENPESRRLHQERSPSTKKLTLTPDVHSVLEAQPEIYHFVLREPPSPSNPSDVPLTDDEEAPRRNSLPESGRAQQLQATSGPSSFSVNTTQGAGVRKKKKKMKKQKQKRNYGEGGGGSTGRGMAFAPEEQADFQLDLALYIPSSPFSPIDTFSGPRSFSSSSYLPKDQYYQDDESCALDAFNLAVGKVILHRRCVLPFLST